MTCQETSFALDGGSGPDARGNCRAPPLPQGGILSTTLSDSGSAESAGAFSFVMLWCALSDVLALYINDLAE
jgi:hypothetical protein